MAQFFYHDRKDTNFKKSFALKTVTQQKHIKLLYIVLAISLFVNIILLFYKF